MLPFGGFSPTFSLFVRSAAVWKPTRLTERRSIRPKITRYIAMVIPSADGETVSLYVISEPMSRRSPTSAIFENSIPPRSPAASDIAAVNSASNSSIRARLNLPIPSTL